jgi:hypothetical protein
MSRYSECAECNKNENVRKDESYGLRDANLIVEMSYLDHVSPVGQDPIDEKAARKDEPDTGHESLPQRDYARRQRCRQRKFVAFISTFNSES